VDGADPNVSILVDGYNTSDHYATPLGINVADNNVKTKNTKQRLQYRLRWDRADLAVYRSTCDNFLATIVIPTEAFLCTLPCCQTPDHASNS